MREIVTIDPNTLKEFCMGKEDYVRTYTDDSRLVRELYWSRLKKMVNIVPSDVSYNRVLDLGCGEGVFLPTLSQYYAEVHGLDVDTKVAGQVVEYFNLKNVQLIEKNIFDNDFEDNFFDIIFAASVLEHFSDQDPLLKELRRLLKKGGMLVFSSPAESFFYELGRKIFRYVKPSDHYYSVFEIADFVSKVFEFVGCESGPFKLLPRQLSVYVVYSFRNSR